MIRFVVLLCFALALVAGASAARADDHGPYWNHRLASQPTNFIFGYGSLISSPSRAETEGKPVAAVPVRISATLGYVRAWNFRSLSGFTALGVAKLAPGETGSTINGVVYPVDGDDMTKFDAREVGYTREEIPRDRIEAVSWLGLPSEGRIWIYVPNGLTGDAGKNLPPASADFPLLQSYIDLVVLGGLEYGTDFAEEILETTRGWSPYWLDDRQIPRRPWVFQPRWQEIDSLLRDHPTYDNRFAERRMAEAYGRESERAATPALAR